ncbi:hypothetical protein PGTUg99_013351 [Puccinia graminis f. sp. tritici]|uniref:Uncharacterized protein n=1 Tax=Puccinia graminis f. sp. tritici TaxID=56615 RepID=A0A5B0RMA9_PUCGR|nr:hypothetical protein PGTUg99_013351 [Puccinia graminis f. sp. tritici]
MKTACKKDGCQLINMSTLDHLQTRLDIFYLELRTRCFAIIISLADKTFSTFPCLLVPFHWKSYNQKQPEGTSNSVPIISQTNTRRFRRSSLNRLLDRLVRREIPVAQREVVAGVVIVSGLVLRHLGLSFSKNIVL